MPLTARALAAYRRLPARLDTPLVFPAPKGGYLSLDNWRTREWYDALDAAGIERRGPYHLRHTFATEALAAGISIFELSRLMGASVTRDRPHLRTSRARLRGRDPGTARREGRIVLALLWRRTRGGGTEPLGRRSRIADASKDGSDGTRTRDLRRDRPAF